MTVTFRTCSALWIGRELGPLHACCLRSFGIVGIPLKLYVYDRPIDVPSNVDLADANVIVPKEKIFRHSTTGSYGVFADTFRYALLRATDEVYVDADVYCIRQIPNNDYIFGWEDDRLINGAILRLPPNSMILQRMINLTTNDIIFPPWVGRKTALLAVLKNLLGDGPTVKHLGFGATGPQALTYQIKELGLADLALPREHFYPVHWKNVQAFLSPKLTVRDIISPETTCIHMYNEILRNHWITEMHHQTLRSKKCWTGA